jgi:hypothetical protein
VGGVSFSFAFGSAGWGMRSMAFKASTSSPTSRPATSSLTRREPPHRAAENGDACQGVCCHLYARHRPAGRANPIAPPCQAPIRTHRGTDHGRCCQERRIRAGEGCQPSGRVANERSGVRQPGGKKDAPWAGRRASTGQRLLSLTGRSCRQLSLSGGPSRP